ncbi:MAG: ParB/RepB/Spo0J family partition protein [Clostridiales bacterium]|jgi:ParB family chromosome partitioning protein|nr:ParB/RepB/Spo0J family partition protein [Clostridiales bacterium]OPZ69426.1 MAG: putative chromosome-partitioning protein ParB [Firmicutes bacterium ADurb.Bin467]
MTAKVRSGLGRGLGALLGEAAEAPESPARDEVKNLKLTDIDPNRGQPRERFDEGALRELAESIKSVGVLQPILVRQTGDRYEIIAGERRYRASRLAGLNEIPAIVRDWDDQRRLEAALVENLQRDDLNPVEEATGVRKLMEAAGLTQERVAERLGKSRPAVANLLRLLTLPEDVQKMLVDGRLSAGHARALVTVDPSRQMQLANLTVQQNWSVRQLERICAQPVKPAPQPKPRPNRQLNELEDMARELFGTRAKIEGDFNRGKLTISYYSAEDLQRIWDALESARK